MAGSACQRGAVPGSLAPTPAARRILEARLRLRGLSRRALPGLRDRRLGGWLLQRGRAPARRSKRAPQGPDRSLVAPYPHNGLPGPAIGFLQEALRWWDHWLKGIDTGIMEQPMLRAWTTESVKPAPYHEELPGRWIAEPSWPPRSVAGHRLFLTDRGLSTETGSL